MGSPFAEVHDELRRVARDLLAPHRPEANHGDAAAPVDRTALAQAGWLGLEVPEGLGGSGATFAEVAVVVGELGRAAAASDVLGTAVLGVGALGLVGEGEVRDELLGAAADGELGLAVAVVDGERDVVPGEVPFRLEGTDGERRLVGRAGYVPDAAGADALLVVARDAGGQPTLVHLRPDQPGLVVTPQPVLDATRRLAAVEVDAAVPPGQVLAFAGDGEAAVRAVLDRAAVATACDALGAARAMLDATVAYAGERVQFGRPIGSFQAVKHACADALVAVSVADRLVEGAVAACAEGPPGDEAVSVAASMAAAHACGAAVDVVGTALQLHGGIGYTWESGVHAYLKRALLDRALFGSPAAHRRWLGARFP